MPTYAAVGSANRFKGRSRRARWAGSAITRCQRRVNITLGFGLILPSGFALRFLPELVFLLALLRKLLLSLLVSVVRCCQFDLSVASRTLTVHVVAGKSPEADGQHLTASSGAFSADGSVNGCWQAQVPRVARRRLATQPRRDRRANWHGQAKDRPAPGPDPRATKLQRPGR